jgi:hypothetical protein
MITLAPSPARLPGALLARTVARCTGQAAVRRERVVDVDLLVISAATGLPAEQLAELPGVLVGSSAQIADTLLRCREEFGITYISVLEDHMIQFGKVIPLLR